MFKIKKVLQLVKFGEMLYAFFIIATLTIVFCRGIFVDETTAIRALEKQGYSNVQVLENGWFLVGWRGCDGNDAAIFRTKATNPANKEVEIDVCTGWPFKGATIRTK